MILRAAACIGLLATQAGAVDCAALRFEDTDFVACTVDATTEDLRLFHAGPDGVPYGSFPAVEAAHGPLAFAMNGAMYHPDRAPVGLFIDEGREVAPLVTSAGPGNFGLLPNGVLCIEETRARVIETLAYAADPPPCTWASQSGPLLVEGDRLHPELLPGSDSLLIRNGVGTSADGSRAVFAIADTPVNFHTFARFFRDRLGLPDALFIDGRVSRLYAPALGRDDAGLPMGPIVGVLLP